MYFVLMEVSKKQGYIFRSNQLKDNIGASMIIRDVTEELPKSRLNKYNGSTVICGGGKGMYFFNNKENAKLFVKELSLEVLKNYEGLEVYFVQDHYNENETSSVEFIKSLYKKLGRKKSERRQAIQQTSFGIESICEATGLPACNEYIKQGEDKRLVCGEIYSKVKYYKERIDMYFSEANIKFYKDLQMLEGDEKSYIAVVHIDGNNMGNKFTSLSKNYGDLCKSDAKYNKEYLEKLKSLSKLIDDTYVNAFIEICKESQDSEGYATIRPIIVAGDDITYVVSAKNALEVTYSFLNKINKVKIDIGEDNVMLNASAGIAFIKSSYPFNRAYELAEELTANCKEKLKLKKEADKYSMIDWHILQGEEERGINELREDKYKKDGLELTLKPIYTNKNDIRSYKVIEETLNVVNSEQFPRSKVKELRNRISKGKNSSDIFIEYYNLSSLVNNVLDYNLKNGIYENKAIFYDAIELMDLIKEDTDDRV